MEDVSFDLPELLFYYTQVYGAQVVILTCLSAMTIFRRQMSCNHVYHDEQDYNNSSPATLLNRGRGCRSHHGSGGGVGHDIVTGEQDRNGEKACHSQSPPLLSLLLSMIRWNEENEKSMEELLLLKEVLIPPMVAGLWNILQHDLRVLDSAEEFLDREGNFYSVEPLLTVMTLAANAAFRDRSSALSDSSARSLNKQDSYDSVDGKEQSSRCQRLQEEQYQEEQSQHNHDDNYKNYQKEANSNHNSVIRSDDYATFTTKELPTDVQVQIMSYLHPRDVVNFACVNRSCQNFVERGESSVALWKTLWDRDYAWIVHAWDIGQVAYQRSMVTMTHTACTASPPSSREIPTFSKTFYFTFGQAYMNYVLAGCNQPDRCLVGLHGNIYDITDFVSTHPGSPDTLLVQAGRDATRIFEDVTHSSRARRLAKTFCVVVDSSYCSLHADFRQVNCGLKPTQKTTLLTNNGNNVPGLSHIDSHIHDKDRNPSLNIADANTITIVSTTRYAAPTTRPLQVHVPASVEAETVISSRQPRQGGTLQAIRNSFIVQQLKHEKLFQKKLFETTISSMLFRRNYLSDVDRSSILGSIKVYYDPFHGEWKAWYTNTNFETVFVQ